MRTSVDVHNFLLERDVPHELVPTRGRLRSPARTAAVLGLPPEQVGRVALFEAEEGLVAALVPAGRDADGGAAGAAAARSIVRAVPEDRGTELTEFLAEALPPVALPEGTAVVIDEALRGQQVLYFPGGEPSTMLKIRPSDLVRATGAAVAPVAR
ncbi:MAG TPA: YbaK/EbsC family protein [Actinomycetota bacterium]|nr:YbaK/EbsC family protein [Actinomycetota bacterium]